MEKGKRGKKIKLCDECKKENCLERVAGGVCSIKENDLVVDFNTRDPVIIARGIANILASEVDRYKKAVEGEKVGEKEERIVVDKEGKQIVVEKTKQLDNKITALASSIIKGSKTVNEIMNPQVNPLIQTNNQYNFVKSEVDQINSLPKEERKKVLKFIDKKLDDSKR